MFWLEIFSVLFSVLFLIILVRVDEDVMVEL